MDKRKQGTALVTGGKKGHASEIAMGAVIAGVVGLVVYFATRKTTPTPPPPAENKGNVYGLVTDAVSGQVLGGVAVSTTGFDLVTDDVGYYAITDMDLVTYQIAFRLEGYETFLPFPRATLLLIEPLRAMRFIHYTAWCARQKADGGFARLASDWGTPGFWRQEVADLRTQRQEIADALRESRATA